MDTMSGVRWLCGGYRAYLAMLTNLSNFSSHTPWDSASAVEGWSSATLPCCLSCCRFMFSWSVSCTTQTRQVTTVPQCKVHVKWPCTESRIPRGWPCCRCGQSRPAAWPVSGVCLPAGASGWELPPWMAAVDWLLPASGTAALNPVNNLRKLLPALSFKFFFNKKPYSIFLKRWCLGKIIYCSLVNRRL